MDRRAAVCGLAAGLGIAMRVPAGAPVPIMEVIDTVRALAAEGIGVKKKDINIIHSLAVQGFNEQSLRGLIVAVQQEFNVVIPEDEIYQAKQNEPAVPLSVRVIADLVVRHQRDPRW
jgi:acyl carrier protein